MIYNIIVLLFEVLYYSMFMKFARNEGKFWKYLLLFSLISIIGIFIGTDNLLSYLILVLLMLYGLKFIVNIKTSLYDMLWIILMLFLKIVLEFTISMAVYYLCGNFIILTILIAVIKIIVVLLLKGILNKIYLSLKTKWDKNNFYIRYIFSCLSIIYVIITVIMFIVDKW